MGHSRNRAQGSYGRVLKVLCRMLGRDEDGTVYGTVTSMKAWENLNCVKDTL